MLSPASTTITNLFGESAQVTRSAQELDDDVFCPSNIIMRGKSKVEIFDRQMESLRNAALHFERERITEKFKEQASLAETVKARSSCRDMG